jgi:hypothetical protein
MAKSKQNWGCQGVEAGTLTANRCKADISPAFNDVIRQIPAMIKTHNCSWTLKLLSWWTSIVLLSKLPTYLFRHPILRAYSNERRRIRYHWDIVEALFTTAAQYFFNKFSQSAAHIATTKWTIRVSCRWEATQLQQFPYTSNEQLDLTVLSMTVMKRLC